MSFSQWGTCFPDKVESCVKRGIEIIQMDLLTRECKMQRWMNILSMINIHVISIDLKQFLELLWPSNNGNFLYKMVLSHNYTTSDYIHALFSLLAKNVPFHLHTATENCFHVFFMTQLNFIWSKQRSGSFMINNQIILLKCTRRWSILDVDM